MLRRAFDGLNNHARIVHRHRREFRQAGSTARRISCERFPLPRHAAVKSRIKTVMVILDSDYSQAHGAKELKLYSDLVKLGQL